MGNKLAGRIGFIVAVLVIFVYGIFGIPHGGFKQSLTDRIHLGLDLRGGTHLVLQVHVLEAVNTATDRDMQLLNTALAGTEAPPRPSWTRAASGGHHGRGRHAHAAERRARHAECERIRAVRGRQHQPAATR